MKTYEHTGNKYEIRKRFFAFSNDCEVVGIEFSEKEAKKTVKMLEKVPAYKGCEFEIVQTMKNWEKISA